MKLENKIVKKKLKLNEQKSEVLHCGPPSRRERECVPVDSLSVGEAYIPFTSVVKTLGVTLFSALPFDHNVSAVVRPSLFRVRPLSRARSYLTRKAEKSTAVSLILQS